jgi:hypothetical protein
MAQVVPAGFVGALQVSVALVWVLEESDSVGASRVPTCTCPVPVAVAVK